MNEQAIMNTVTGKLALPYYTRQNLELILGSNRRTLDYRISKLILNGNLEALKPGFYINKKLFLQSNQKEEFLEYVGSIAKYPSYVSLEYALSKYGLIPESIYIVTYLTIKKPGEYSSDSFSFRYRNIKTELFSDYEEREFNGGKYLFAKKGKALFDLIYLTPLGKKSDFTELLFGSRINWTNLSEKDKNDFVEICNRSKSKKMEKVVKLLTGEGFL
jgi:hypothetical protein